MSQINVDVITPQSGTEVEVNGVFISSVDEKSGIKINTVDNPLAGVNNTYIGWQAGISLTSGSNGNTLLGKQTGVNVTSGSSNVLIGAATGQSITTGYDNTMIGTSSGSICTGNSNVFVGTIAGNTTTTGENNIAIGNQAVAPNATTDNSITLGNSYHNVLRCAVTSITSLSDVRDKSKIEESCYGLNLVKDLKPVTFEWNTRDGAKKGVKDLGFIAQDLKELDDEHLNLVYDENPDKLEASYGRLIPVLVKAIQELSAEVESLKNK